MSHTVIPRRLRSDLGSGGRPMRAFARATYQPLRARHVSMVSSSICRAPSWSPSLRWVRTRFAAALQSSQHFVSVVIVFFMSSIYIRASRMSISRIAKVV